LKELAILLAGGLEMEGKDFGVGGLTANGVSLGREIERYSPNLIAAFVVHINHNPHMPKEEDGAIKSSWVSIRYRVVSRVAVSLIACEQ
jgi:hypothetical protein